VDKKPLYNSRIIRVFVEYLEKHHPEVDICALLDHAGITMYALHDGAHWFTQGEVDRFYDIALSKTKDARLAREAGRFAASSKGTGAARQYLIGFMSVAQAYLLMGKIYPHMSLGARIKTNKLSANSVEITATPEPGVNEKPYQCENRMGMFEAVATFFTHHFAEIEHPSCFHRGDDCCRYIISWRKSPSLIWKRVRNYAMLIFAILSLILFFFLSTTNWLAFMFIGSLVVLVSSLYSDHLQRVDLLKSITIQGDAAKKLLDETNTRYNKAVFVQEMGQAISHMLDVDKLLAAVADIMHKRLDFDRGVIMLANGDRTRLVQRAGYGYGPDLAEVMKDTGFHLDNPRSRGVGVKAFRGQQPYLINSVEDIKGDLSEKSSDFISRAGSESFICVPIVYEKESLGLIMVDNVESKKPLTGSDLNLIKGVASQTAAGIVNARSFRKLRESEENYRDLVENANSIIMRIDARKNITFFNEFAQRFFAYSEVEIIGESVESAIFSNIPSGKPNIRNLLESLRQGKQKKTVTECETVRRDGTKAQIAWTFKPSFDKNGALKEVLCVGSDVTMLHQERQKKEALEARLQRAQKMEAIGTLAGGVAHDLNNILSGLVSYPELILMGVPEESPLRKPILTIQKSGEKAAAIVQDMLTLARRGVIVKDVVNLNDVIGEYLKSPEHDALIQFHPAFDIEAKLEPELLNISGSPVHLSKAVMNLISNAAEAMPEGGKVTLITENRYVDSPVRGYDEVEPGDYVVLSVADSGTGISEEDRDRIFEPFYTKKVMGRSGTGLGMSVVWGTVKDHEGYIDMESVEGRGSTFTLYFPVTRALVEEGRHVSPEAYMGRGESILIVDDVAEQREIASGMLKKLNYSVATVSGGEEALDYLRDKAVDLVVLDMVMDPGIDGLDTYRKMIEFKPGQKAVIASGFSETDRVKEARRLGAGAYIKKPYLMEKIGPVIRAELDR